MLPPAITVRVLTSEAPSRPIPGILITLDVLHDAAYYYGTISGLTDEAGSVRIARQEVLDCFARDRGLFPADYKVDLEEGDVSIRVRVTGGRSFLKERQEALASDLTAPDARETWQEARNAAVGNAACELACNPDQPIEVRLEVSESTTAT